MTNMDNDSAARIAAIMASDDVAVLPVGAAEAGQRGIMGPKTPEQVGWRRSLLVAFGATAMMAALSNNPVQAAGNGYDAGVYAQTQGQVMQQGTGVRMTVISVRPVSIELPREQPTQAQQVARYGVTTGAGAIGAMVGNAMGGNNGTMRTVLGIIGGGAGAWSGAKLGESITHNEARYVAGSEITMENSNTHQIAVVTQAGEQQFANGEHVLLLNINGASRVVPDPTPVVERTDDPPQRLPAVTARSAEVIARTASLMGLQIDRARVAEELGTGLGPMRGTFDGTIVGVDRQSGLVYQSLGRGRGFVYLADTLSRLPGVGERVSIHFHDGHGTVGPHATERVRSQGLGRS